MSWLDAVTNPLNAATKTLQELMETRDLVKFGDTFRKMHGEILAATKEVLTGYQRELALSEQVGTLKASVAKLEAQNAQLERYELKGLGWGAFAYMLKPDARGVEKPHWACTNCYADRRISIIQWGLPVRRKEGRKIHFCPSCQNEINPSPDAYTPGTQDPRWLE